MKTDKKLTSLQKEVVLAIGEDPRGRSDLKTLSFVLGKEPKTVGKVLKNLTAKDLVYLANTELGLEAWLTPDGQDLYRFTLAKDADDDKTVQP